MEGWRTARPGLGTHQATRPPAFFNLSRASSGFLRTANRVRAGTPECQRVSPKKVFHPLAIFEKVLGPELGNHTVKFITKFQ